MFSIFGSKQPTFQQSLQSYLQTKEQTFDTTLFQKLISIFRGQNPTIKSQIAYAKFVDIIRSNRIQQPFLRILRELVILDKLIDENLFSQEIENISMNSIEKYKDYEFKEKGVDLSKILKNYLKTIKIKCNILNNPNHVFNFKRSQRISFIAALTPSEILNQVSSIETYLNSLFDFVQAMKGETFQIKSKQLKRKPIFEFILVQILAKLSMTYTCLIVCRKQLLSQMSFKRNLTLQEVHKYKRFILKLKEYSHKLTTFINEHKDVKQIQSYPVEQLKNTQNDQLLKLLDQYIQQFLINQQPFPLQQLPQCDEPLIVQKNQFKRQSVHPRIKLSKHLSSQPSRTNLQQLEPSQTNPFLNWHNSYSSEFPQKQIMTIDLIMRLKMEENSTENQPQDVQIYQANEYNYGFERTSNNLQTSTVSGYDEMINTYILKQIENLTVKSKKISIRNRFSDVDAKWNYQ